MVKNIKFLSIKEACNESRNMYNHEVNRFQSIENKTTALLTLNSILCALLGLYIIFSSPWFLLPILFLLVSIFYAFKVYYLKESKRPHMENYEDFYDYAKLDNYKFFDKVLLNYTKAANAEKEINNDKTSDLSCVILFSIFAWISFIFLFFLSLICF